MDAIFVVILAFMIIVMAVTLLRLRKRGPGPAVYWVPRGLRSRVNRHYAEQGWSTPYDERGHRKRDRELP
ncbi:hypothetical protein D0T12_20360 [Actinomadura spongiicola]|uniref:Uncharacterized protein n=1 Tax=Actinomadura spongiicola TaxID=2303421 RepID=A0A372GDI7_9ACTN|nr:hypothetical protein [Actinomadura spongiicola]RFS83410.1 hypothetical protein D0T12_20360 [Actinomadura spongiicola]